MPHHCHEAMDALTRTVVALTAIAARVRSTLAPSIAVVALLLAGCAEPLAPVSHVGTPLAPPASAAHVYYAYPRRNTTPSGAPSPVGSAVAAFDANNGAIVWRDSAPTELFQPFAMDGLVLASSYIDDPRTSQLVALDPQTGKTVWLHDTPGTLTNPPVIAGGALYVSSSQEDSIGGYTGLLQALDERSGELRWQFPIAEFPSPATVEGNTIYLTGAGSVLGTSAMYALAADTGTVRWRYTAAAQLATTDYRPGLMDAKLPPMLAGGLVTIISTTRDSQGGAIQAALALDAASGKPRWSYSTGGIAGAPVIAHGAMYINADVQAGNTTQSFVAALRMSDGALLWRREVGAGVYFLPDMAYMDGQGAANGAHLLAIESIETRGVAATSMVGLAPDDGRMLWTTPIGQDAIGPLLLADGLVLTKTVEQGTGHPGVARLLALQPTNGQIRWRQVIGQWPEFNQAPTFVAGGSVYATITTFNGNVPTVYLLALRLSDGARQWQVKPQ